MGTPSSMRCGTPANFSCSGSLDAKTRDNVPWSARSMFSPKRPTSRTIGSVRASLSKQTSTSSGLSDSEHTALAVIPTGPRSPTPVTTATPVGKWPKRERKCCWSPSLALTSA